MTSTEGPAPSWYPDPLGRHEHRYWDGERWTVHVADHGVTGIEGGAQQPLVQQPAAQQPAAHETVVPERRPVAPQWQPVSQPPTPTATWPAAAATPAPIRSSKARGWIVALALVVAIGAAGLTAVLALGRDDSSGTSTASDGNRYPAVVETNFMTGCTSNGGNTSYCRCALDHLENDYDLGEFAEAERSYATTGKLPDSMMSAVNDCLHFLLPQPQS